MDNPRQSRAYYRGDWVYSRDDDDEIRRDQDAVTNDYGTGWGTVADTLEQRYGATWHVGRAGGTVCLTAYFESVTVCVTGDDGDLGNLDEWNGGTFHVYAYPPDDDDRRIGMGWGSDPLASVDESGTPDALPTFIARAIQLARYATTIEGD